MSTKNFHSEAELVQACLKNNRLAQKELYLRFSYMMKGVCLRYSSNQSEAEDLLQESFMKVFKSLNSYTDENKLGAWLRKITLNCALEKYRSEKKKKETILYVDTYYETNSSFEDDLAQLDLKDLLEKIQVLPLGYRTVFNLFAIEGYQHDEIADMLGISTGTSKSQYSRAKSMLREMIEKEEKLIHLKPVNYEK